MAVTVIVYLMPWGRFISAFGLSVLIKNALPRTGVTFIEKRSKLEVAFQLARIVETVPTTLDGIKLNVTGFVGGSADRKSVV
jgi:hypothetical protein